MAAFLKASAGQSPSSPDEALDSISNSSLRMVFHRLDISKTPNDLSHLSFEERSLLVESISDVAGEEGFSEGSSRSVIPMPWYEQFMCILIFMIVPSGPLVFMALFLFTLFFASTWNPMILLILAIISLSIHPVYYWEASTRSVLAHWIIKYFSFKGIWSKGFLLDPSKKYILVSPPHGAFPFGNICTILMCPRLMGVPLRGLAASVIFRVPGFRHFLRWIGAVEADRHTAERLLKQGHTIGVSSGGIAEIFETNGDHETIILRSRKGLVRLAMRTGTPLVPCYVFGNSAALSLWYDEYGFLVWMSRTLRTAFFIFWGRWGLPIPYRTPITGVLGKPIHVSEDADPKEEEVEELLEKLVEAMIDLFDTHKASYGWANKKLIVK